MGYVLAVFLLVFGALFALLVPLAVRWEDGSVFKKTLAGTEFASGACLMLSLGGAIMASLASAPALAEWLSIAAIVGAGLFTPLYMTDTIKSRVARRRQHGEPR